jgi:hypothetical protein
MQEEGIRSRIVYMGYWKAKRGIEEISCVCTLRTQTGEVLTRHTQVIADSRAYRVELASLLEEAGLDRETPFLGSVEAEFFCAQNLFFPFPAVVVNYYGPQFSCAVHSAQRVYNDFDDWQENSLSTVPESGFNIYADDEREAFITLINGPQVVPESTVKVEAINAQGESLIFRIPLGRLAPYQTEWLYLEDHADLQSFLGRKEGCAKVHFEVEWIYPRLIVGNRMRLFPGLNVTHSYYDCSDARSSGDYWHASMDAWHPASLMVPVQTDAGQFSNAYFYPIISPSELYIDVELYDTQGRILGRKERALKITSPAQRPFKVDFKQLCQELGVQGESLGGRLIAHVPNEERVPARLKVGLDLGFEGKGLPCNICTNLHPFNPGLEKKPECFRWAPLLADQEQASLWLLNSAPAKDYTRSAAIEVRFYREQDEEVLRRTYVLAPHAHERLRLSEDAELRSFFQGQVGWMTATSSNPYISSYFFSENDSGMTGGDHGF